MYSILSDGECFLNEVFEDSIYIDIDNRKRFLCFTVYGSTHSFPNGCVLLFPSREMRDWHKFAWKKGDVLISNDGKKEVFFNGFTDDTYALFKKSYQMEILYILQMKMVLQRVITLSETRILLRTTSILLRNVWAASSIVRL